MTVWWIEQWNRVEPGLQASAFTQKKESIVGSKWNDPNSTAYWNKRLKEEGMETVKGRQVFKRKTGRYSGKPLAQPLPGMKRGA